VRRLCYSLLIVNLLSVCVWKHILNQRTKRCLSLTPREFLAMALLQYVLHRQTQFLNLPKQTHLHPTV
jgi:hypothetical protein